MDGPGPCPVRAALVRPGSVQPRPSPPAAGAILGGRFRLLEPIGRGGFGDVWRAEELLPNGTAIRQVALKLLSPDTNVDDWGEEAKLLASFSHPSLVVILAAGLIAIGTDEAPVPFVAMEMLDGETLAGVLARRGAIPWRRVLAWARDVASALDAIHTRGVVHLDLKPSNLFLTSEGRLKVLDFGIARRLGGAPSATRLGASSPDRAEPGDDGMETAEFLAEHAEPPSGAASRPRPRTSPSVVGTLGFMAPEVIEERPATPAADAYALAACIVQLATGRLPHDVPEAPPTTSDSAARHAFWAEVRHSTMTGRLRDLDADLPRGVASLCRRLLALEPTARDVSPGGLRDLLDAAWERPFGVPDPPYLGLNAYGPESEGMLFGRDDDVARLRRELLDRTALVLQGVSGSGKSSLAMAGLVPALARRDAARGRDWRAIVIRPEGDPDSALRRALESITPELAEASPAEVAAWCEARALGIAFVFDQLEELCTQSTPALRARFVAFLASASALPPSASIRVIGTLREDFTSGLLALEPLGERLRDALRFVGPPTAAAVRDIVGQPASLSGVRVEGLSEVADDVSSVLRAGDGRLPLVALALAAWWKTREDGVLHGARYTALGGVRKIFAAIADGVFAALDAPAQAEARAALVELCHDNRTRRSVARAELRSAARDAAAFDRAVAAFAAEGLLVEAGDRLEVVHEFLFTAWERLDGWLGDAHASRRLAAALREDARTWRELGRPPARLPGDHEEALARVVFDEGGLTGEGADLVHEWLAARRSRARWQRVKGVTFVVALFVVVASGLAAWGKTVNEAQRRADQAKREATEASEQMLVNQARAAEAQREADASRTESERVAKVARRQQEEFDRLLRDAESEIKRTLVRCSVVQNAPRIRSGGCPPGDPLCSSVPTVGGSGSLPGSLDNNNGAVDNNAWGSAFKGSSLSSPKQP